MNVTHLPDFTRSNPYQQALVDSLNQKGVSATLASGYPIDSVYEIFKSNTDIIHFHWVSPYIQSKGKYSSLLKSRTFLFLQKIAKSLGYTIVWTVHNIGGHESQHKEIEYRTLQKFSTYCDHIIVHCRHAGKLLSSKIEADPTNVSVIPHGNYIYKYDNEVAKSEARSRFNFKPNETVFLHLGQIRRYKQVNKLIKSFDELSCGNDKLIIAGSVDEGVEFKSLNSILQSDDIQFEDRYIPDNELQYYFNACDVVVLPYRDILTSGSIIMAMGFKKPIIAPSIGCIPEDLAQQSELLYDPDETPLVEMMEKAKEIPNLKTIGQKNYDKIANRDWREIASDTIKSYKAAINNH
ncbi:glycosyltransferase [Haladaptatus sp. YSMS36]|uniref:glycosyltransferase n=1 Tax=Haladaptatus sp. YSMS36 TaxID=3033384 RepID=UPI0023E82DFD|nr:glycosyltransferase [Haladaptatus sp. YSMS36]